MELGQEVTLLSTAALDRALEALSGPLRIELPVARLDEAVDRILGERARRAPNAIIRSVYEAMVGKVGAAHAAACRRRVETFVNGARFSALRARGVPEPELSADAPEMGYSDARRLLDKLPNYQIDLEAVCAEIERR